MLIKNTKWKNITILSIVFFFIVLFFEILPGYAELISASAELLFREDPEEQMTKSEARLIQLKAEKRKLKVLASSQFSGYNEGGVSSIIALLDESAAKSNSEIISLKPGNFKKNDNIVFQPVNMEMYAGYENLYNYLRFLENTPKVLHIKKLSIKEFEEDDLIITAELEAYLNL